MAVVDGSTLSAAGRVALLEAPHLVVDSGCELLDADDVMLGDISEHLVPAGSSVSRGIYRTVHGSCVLNLSVELQWGWQRVRPYILLSSDAVTFYRWNLGVFLLSTPDRQVSVTPPVWTVSGFDKLDVLNTPHGQSYALAAGEVVLDAVSALIVAAGESKVRLDATAAAVTTPSARVFPMSGGEDSGDTTTLNIINQLLSSIGYRSLWVDRDGWYRSEPYRSPAELPSVWSYSADSATTMVSQERVQSADFYDAANVVVAVNDDPEASSIPMEGDGMFTLSNQSDGPTSIDGRGGREIRRVLRGQYTSQSALESAARQSMDAQKRLTTYVHLSASPNPIHGHFDAVNYSDAALSVNGRYLVTDWDLPLDGSDMSLSLKAV